MKSRSSTVMGSMSHVGDGSWLYPRALRRRLQWRSHGLRDLEFYKAANGAGYMGFLISPTMLAAGTANAANPIRTPLNNSTSQLVGAARFGEGDR